MYMNSVTWSPELRVQVANTWVRGIWGNGRCRSGLGDRTVVYLHALGQEQLMGMGSSSSIPYIPHVQTDVLTPFKTLLNLVKGKESKTVCLAMPQGFR